MMTERDVPQFIAKFTFDPSLDSGNITQIIHPSVEVTSPLPFRSARSYKADELGGQKLRFIAHSISGSFYSTGDNLEEAVSLMAQRASEEFLELSKSNLMESGKYFLRFRWLNSHFKVKG